MIRRVSIKGFQSLREVSVDLGSFTVIQGRSNSGKSAFVRALRAAASNGANLRGTGGSFISHGASECSVTIDRGPTNLEWVKSPKKTTYVLGDKVFTTGQEVPEDVSEFLGLGELVIDTANNLKVNVNFQGGGRGQGQFETPFLVVDTSGSYIAKVLSLLTSANMLYAAQALAKKRSKSAADKLKALREIQADRLVRIDSQRSSYAPIHAASGKASDLLSAVRSLEESQATLIKLSTNLENLTTALEKASQYQSKLSIVPAGEVERILHLQGELSRLERLEQAYSTLKSELASSLRGLNRLSAADIDSLLGSVVTLHTHLLALQKWREVLDALDASRQQLSSAISVEYEQQQAERDALDTLVNSLEVCPTCNQEISVVR